MIFRHQTFLVRFFVLAVVAGVHLSMPTQTSAKDMQSTDPEEAIKYLTYLLDRYPLRETAEEMKALIQEKLQSDSYASLNSREDLAKALTSDLRSVKRDFHLGVQYSPEASTEDTAHNLDDPEVMEQLRTSNFGFEEVRILEGNVGFLKITALNTPDIASEAVHHTLGFLQNVDALIIDLRGNLGGEPEMVRLLQSAFFKDAVHLNTLYFTDDREDNKQEIWSDPELIDITSLHDKPIYVLTNFYVASGAEDFAYSLQAQKRATIIGAKTLGAAHPGTAHYRVDLQLSFNMPHGYAKNPITGTNWEGVGVQPHVQSTEEEAFDTALSLAWANIDYDPISEEESP